MYEIKIKQLKEEFNNNQLTSLFICKEKKSSIVLKLIFKKRKRAPDVEVFSKT